MVLTYSEIIEKNRSEILKKWLDALNADNELKFLIEEPKHKQLLERLHALLLARFEASRFGADSGEANKGKAIFAQHASFDANLALKLCKVLIVYKQIVADMLEQAIASPPDLVRAYHSIDAVFHEINVQIFEHCAKEYPLLKTLAQPRKSSKGSQLPSQLNLFYKAFQHSTDGIIITDLDGTILEANQAFVDIFGYEYDEVIGKNTRILRAASTRDEIYNEMWASITEKGEWKGEIVNRRKTGEEIPVWVSITPIYESGKVVAYMAVEIDLSEKKKIENELVKEKKFTESLLDTANSLIVGLNLRGEITLFNKKLEQVTGYSRADVLGKSWIDIFIPAHERPNVYEVFNNIVNGELPSYYENIILNKSGQPRLIAWNNAPIHNEKNQIAGALGIGQDVTEQKRLETQILQSERLATIGQMASKVAHEIRNPLSSISLNAELLEDEIQAAGQAVSEDAEVLLQSIISEVDRVEKLTEEYLQFSRLPEADLCADDLLSLVQEVLDFIEPEANSVGVQIIKDYKENIPTLVFDRQQIRRVLFNIAKNAIEAMKHGGIMRVRLQVKPDDVELAISDTGNGIPERHRERVFEPFFTTKDMGTGLGLAISQQIIQEHGGSIFFESQPGKGTTFCFRLPKKQKQSIE